MNVYSIRLIPSLKLKCCEWLGVASRMAVEDLASRLDRLERQVNRYKVQARRTPPLQRVLSSVFKDRSPSEQPKAVRRPPLKAVDSNESSVRARQEVKKTEEALQNQASTAVAHAAPPKVILVQADPETRAAVTAYFGGSVEYVELDDLGHLSVAAAAAEVRACFFDRALLGEASMRAELQGIAQRFPQLRMIGLSRYLTSALDIAMPEGAATFATFLTRPLTVESLNIVFASLREALAKNLQESAAFSGT